MEDNVIDPSFYGTFFMKILRGTEPCKKAYISAYNLQVDHFRSNLSHRLFSHFAPINRKMECELICMKSSILFFIQSPLPYEISLPLLKKILKFLIKDLKIS